MLAVKKAPAKHHVDNFLFEMEMLLKIGRHENIVNLIGVVLKSTYHLHPRLSTFTFIPVPTSTPIYVFFILSAGWTNDHHGIL